MSYACSDTFDNFPVSKASIGDLILSELNIKSRVSAKDYNWGTTNMMTIRSEQISKAIQF